mgnify:CR=1 FL=1
MQTIGGRLSSLGLVVEVFKTIEDITETQMTRSPLVVLLGYVREVNVGVRKLTGCCCYQPKDG